MIDANKLQYFTMAAWMRGYATSLDEYQHRSLIFKLNKAADMLDAVWGQYQKEEEKITPEPAPDWHPTESRDE
jgi:hypothetical protein